MRGENAHSRNRYGYRSDPVSRLQDRLDLDVGGRRVDQADDVLLVEPRRRFGADGGEHGVRERPGLTAQPAQPPVPRQGRDQPQRDVRRLGDAPAQRRVQVGVLGGQLRQDHELVRAAQFRLGRVGEVEEVLRVRRVVAGALLRAERPDRLQHPVAAVAVLDERLLDEPGEQAIGVRDGADALDGGEARAAA